MSEKYKSAQERYEELFPATKTLCSKTKLAQAYRVAIDTRKFEIEMYWKRATYFWAFIAVTFAGYGLINRVSPKDEILLFFLACFGFILSWAWYFANRGSKQWQENWEHHVDHLEDAITGPLYKTVLRRVKPKGLSWISFILSGPSKHSVSKINQIISLYIALMWSFLVYYSKQNWLEWDTEQSLIALLTLFALISVMFIARTHTKPHHHVLEERESKLTGRCSDELP